LNSARPASSGPPGPTRNLTATLERLRVDRQLEEALTHGADPLHLALVFGIDEKTAIRYADSAPGTAGSDSRALTVALGKRTWPGLTGLEE
jgi:hypothetical protein